MTAADTTPASFGTAAAHSREGATSRLLGAIGLTYLALLVISLPQLADPYLRHDDFPALLAAPAGFYEKTLQEGRWLNYWWHLRGFVSPSWLNYALYQFFWAAFSAATAVAACHRSAVFAQVMLMALLIVVSVPAMMISLWFNTLLPGLGIVALYAVLATRLSPQTMRLLLLIFVPVTLTAYTTYPFLLLGVCLVMQTGQSAR